MKKLNLKKLKLILILAIAVGIFLSTLTYAEEPNYVPNEIIVKFKAEVADSLERIINLKEGVAPSQVRLAAPIFHGI